MHSQLAARAPTPVHAHATRHARAGLTEELHDDGFTDIVNVDLSPTVIAAMRARYGRERPSLTWHVANVTALGGAGAGLVVPDASLGAVVDKGTLDSLLCGEAATAAAARYAAEASRVLRPGGVFIVVSFGGPDSRLAYLDKAAHRWTVTVHRVREFVRERDPWGGRRECDFARWIAVVKGRRRRCGLVGGSRCALVAGWRLGEWDNG